MEVIDSLITEYLMTLLMISITFSMFTMVLIDQLKKTKFLKKEWHIWLLDLFLSFAIGIPFSMFFYDIDILSAIWVGLFSFIGAPNIYKLLKNQELITYDSNKIAISKENEIKRETN